MSDDVFRRVAKVLDTLPNGFPAAENGMEIKLLKAIFTEEDADLFCDLRLTFETVEQIAERTGRPLEGLEEKLDGMRSRGQIFSVSLGDVKIYQLVPWAFGIYEFQLDRLDRELAELCEEYNHTYFRQFFENKPQLMQVIPIEREIEASHESLSYEQVSGIIETGQSFAVNDCICKKEKHLLDNGCDKPLAVCLAIAPIPDVFNNGRHGRVLTKEETYELLEKCEEAGLVHLTWNTQSGHFFICNCCGCCCGILRGTSEFGMLDVVNSAYIAEIDPEACISCGLCRDERCQVKAIEETDEAYRVIEERCIGCGLCVGTCPSEAIELVRKAGDKIKTPPASVSEWYDERGKARGVDFSQYR